ncbi:hypothetical protein K502DRAFT_209677 [Neoconidiobolus thromboides FSU 785]|nr:hypothetical protein K502DRAFT_209677 [Neoconidiobolus thromboides FSU 785]
MLIWNDQELLGHQMELTPNDSSLPNFFEYFLEHNLHIYMCWTLGLGDLKPHSENPFSCYTFSTTFQSDRERDSLATQALIHLKRQVLQSLNILFESIKNQQMIYYLLSNNFINRLVCKPNFNNEEMEELLPYFIALLKALSFKLKLEQDKMLPFFYNSGQKDLPIYKEAIKYFDHSDAMVRVAIRTITLNIASVKNQEITSAMLHPDLSDYFNKVIDKLLILSIKMDQCLGNNNNKEMR